MSIFLLSVHNLNKWLFALKDTIQVSFCAVICCFSHLTFIQCLLHARQCGMFKLNRTRSLLEGWNHPLTQLLPLFSFHVVSNSSISHELQHSQASLSFTVSWSLFRLVSIESVMPSNHLILCLPLLLLPSIFPSIRVFSHESALCIRWSKYWSFSFSISPCSEYSGLISFKNHWFDLLTVQETLERLSNTPVWTHQFFGAEPFFMVQLSHL